MPALRIEGPGAEPIWDQTAYEFITGDAPASVNPSLWRQAQLNNMHGLYQVADRIYQLRGHDLANMTIIEGDSGWILVDPLTAKETAAVALDFAREHLGNKPVVAVLFTHSHIDHFGGVLGVVSPADVASGKVQIIAPDGFMEEVTSENVIAGIAMSRRSAYMYGTQLARTERGHVGSGLGKNPAIGSPGVLEPTTLINDDLLALTIDGVDFEFLYAPESEAPAEFMFYLPQMGAFCGAEVVSSTLHNLYTLRGAKVRNATRWSGYIDESIERFGEAEIYFGSHHWPRWGNDNVVEFLEVQRDTYQYIHDQTVRMFNNGKTPGEIADELTLPESLRGSFANRDYYGTVRHNARAVYQAYLGWYDANPAHLNPLPPQQAGTRYVEMMGGAQALLDNAQTYYEQGDYRWVAEVVNHLVFAEPGNVAARALLAQTYDQLGYQAESGPWRDVYLTAALELRRGAPKKSSIDLASARDLLRQTPVPLMLDSMAVRLNGPEAEGVELRLKMVFTDSGESYLLTVENSVLRHRRARPDDKANTTLTLTYDLFLDMALKTASLKDTLLSDDLSIDGSKLDLVRFFSLQDQPQGVFNIVTP
ncbi:MBL fold metallo-hydrolase [Halieaceae bacterium IMCC14734]|uniref:MBL fold metallo-hydrolase n=2 Tax=Candidatus Litorirhabdus singularis TaxID=2518993 RepID=A0ABT3TGZ4_9GAMM|nr:MBL fold metallo-hydrolase [Candidatus Litorirhabdus singularis]